jgi:hypothetical protein
VARERLVREPDVAVLVADVLPDVPTAPVLLLLMRQPTSITSWY